MAWSEGLPICGTVQRNHSEEIIGGSSTTACIIFLGETTLMYSLQQKQRFPRPATATGGIKSQIKTWTLP